MMDRYRCSSSLSSYLPLDHFTQWKDCFFFLITVLFMNYFGFRRCLFHVSASLCMCVQVWVTLAAGVWLRCVWQIQVDCVRWLVLWWYTWYKNPDSLIYWRSATETTLLGPLCVCCGFWFVFLFVFCFWFFFQVIFIQAFQKWPVLQTWFLFFFFVLILHMNQTVSLAFSRWFRTHLCLYIFKSNDTWGWECTHHQRKIVWKRSDESYSIYDGSSL